MAILKINYQADAYIQLLNAELTPDTFLTNVLNNTADKIIEHLTQYHSQHGDTCQIDYFELTESSYQPDQQSGKVVISYLIQYHYGCADITRSAKDHETWKFEIDADRDTLLLHMPEYEVRSTQDEF
jgi:hypothetical protein